MVLPIGSHTAIENQKETVAMTTPHRAAATALLVLSLAAASAPIAGARPTDFAPAGKQAPASVYSRPDKSLVRVNSQSTLNDDAETNPALPPILPRTKPSERAAIQAQRQASAVSPSKGGPYSTAELNAYADTATGHVTAAAVGATTPHNSFAWGDAGIGAAGGLALAMLGVGGGLVISRQRPRRTRPTTTVPS
jgi:hypothetical protein